jgi:hypothetical protein
VTQPNQQQNTHDRKVSKRITKLKKWKRFTKHGHTNYCENKMYCSTDISILSNHWSLAIISIGLLCRCVDKETIYGNTDQLQDKTDDRLRRN